MKQSCLALAVLALGASGASALEVTKQVPDKVWAAIGDFCGIAKWHPAVEKCTSETKDGVLMRTLSLKGGGAILEKQVKRDDAAMSYTYAIIESPLPVANYVSTISVAKAGAGSTITWTGKFDAKGAPDAKAMDGHGRHLRCRAGGAGEIVDNAGCPRERKSGGAFRGTPPPWQTDGLSCLAEARRMFGETFGGGLTGRRDNWLDRPASSPCAIRNAAAARRHCRTGRIWR